MTHLEREMHRKAQDSEWKRVLFECVENYMNDPQTKDQFNCISFDEYATETLQLMLYKLSAGNLDSDDYMALANWAKFLEGQFIMRAAVRGGVEGIERIKNSNGGSWGPSFMQLDLELSRYK